MLRPKQIGVFSNTARSFFLSGSRCGAPDGNSCTCSGDETCIPKKQNERNENRNSPKLSSLIPKISPGVGTAVLPDANKVLVNHKAEVDRTNYVPKVKSAPRTLSRSDCAKYVNNIQPVETDIGPEPPMSDHFVRAGIAALNFLSDVTSNKVPIGSGMLNSPPNCMDDPKRHVPSVTPARVKVKPVSTNNMSIDQSTSSADYISSNHSKSSGGSAVGSNIKYQRASGKSDKSSFVKDFSHAQNIGKGTSDTYVAPSKNKNFMPQRPKSNSNSNSYSFTANCKSSGQSAEAHIHGVNREGFNNSRRDTRTAGIALSRQLGSSGHVVEHISNLIRQLKWGPAAEEALGKLNVSVDAYQANQVLKLIQDHSVALGFFNWLRRQPGFKHDGHTYTTMVGILGRAKQFGMINRLLDQMILDGCQPNVVTFNRLIHSYGRANFLTEAFNVFNHMQEAGCEPDKVTYCTLIDIHAKAGYLDIAMHMYQKMQEVGLSPDTFTYSVMINCLGKAGHLTAAQKLFYEMVEHGCVPNVVTYNIMIALLAKARSYESALQLYRDMQNAGFEPDNVTYSIVMEALGHCGQLEEAEAVFHMMMQKNWVPDEPVYGLLVDLWGKAGNVDRAWGWYHAMLDAGLRPNVPTCNSMLSAFLRVHRLSDAYNLLQGMLSLGLNPSSQTYTLLLSCSTEAQSTYDMVFCGELMAATGHPAHRFLVSMPAAGPDGQNVRDHANRFLDYMHCEDRESKRGLVDAVVDFLHKSGLKEEAGSVWEVAAQKNIYPDAVTKKGSCYWLINLHVMSDGTAVTALSRTLSWFRHRMLASGISPSRIDIVTGWGRRSKITGSSLVRQSVEELLNVFRFPFFTENGNSGCFVGCGEPLSAWLGNSYVDRMHLL
uniref:Smr domain-containing protein n=1 Tax=Kalanchoe fedtschenkoi TaxID=63787 RepID=A0A7N0TWN4_KALFE